MALRQAETSCGRAEGIEGKNPAITVFRGVPYAKPPVGERRFCPPVEPEGWEGIRTFDTFSKACIQSKWPGNGTETSEDCLTLNIFTPAASAEERLPVLFWIYGGAFRGGSGASSEFDGEMLASKGAIVVTFNYRCTALGFFSTKALEERLGAGVNLGLLDQIAALRWVQKNIAAFGGDRSRVTVFGQSAGGISVRMLLASPSARGLFSRAIVQSGGGLNEADPVRTKEEFQSLCQQCMDRLGWTVEDLLCRDAEEIKEKLEEAAREVLAGREVALFQPFLDEVSLTEVPGKAIARGEYADVPIICGTVAGDSWMFSRKVREQIEDPACFRGFSLSPSQSWGRRQLELGRALIYTYYMDRKQPPREMHFRRGAPPYGDFAPHGTEIAYVFGTLATRGQAYAEWDYQISEQMQRFWVNFTATGDPNGPELPVWPAFAESRQTLHIGDEGISAEDAVQNPTEDRVITYTMEHPGLLEFLEGF